MRPEYLTKCGGSYSSEWFWSKIWHCLNIDEEVFNSAHTWIEQSDFIPAMLAGIKNIGDLKRKLFPFYKKRDLKFVFQKLQEGYSNEKVAARLVVGCVRKYLSGESIDDIDIATILTSEEINRKLVDHLADINLTYSNRKNMQAPEKF